MIEKVTHVPMIVSDQDRALEFYTSVLGFEKRSDYQKPGHPRWLTMAPKGQDIEVTLVKGTFERDPRPPRDRPSGGHHWALKTRDGDAFAKLQARGLRFQGAPQKHAWGTSAYFTDPDGNHLALVQPVDQGKASPKVPLIEAVTHMPVVVRDQEKALEFYTRTLGFEKRADTRKPGEPRWVTVAPKGQDIEISLVQGHGTVRVEAPPEAGSGGNHVALKTTECRGDYEAFKARGVAFKDEPEKQPWGTSAYFTDPDGNHLAMVQPGAIAKVFAAVSRLRR